MKIMIIEDEPVAIKRINPLLQEINPTIEVVITTKSIRESVAWLKNHAAPDIILMDVELADGNCFEIFKLTTIISPVIFITSYGEYAIKAIKHSAIDYLLKPVNIEDLAAALNKVKQNNPAPKQNELIKTLLSVIQPAFSDKRLAISNSDGIIYLEQSKIVKLVADSNYTNIYLIDGRKIMASKTLKDFETILNSQSFFRIHNSFIINLNYVDKYSRVDGGMLILKDGTQIEVSRRKKKELHELLSINGL